MARIGGKDAKHMCREVFKRMVSPNLGVQLNLTGQAKKGALNNSYLTTVINRKCSKLLPYTNGQNQNYLYKVNNQNLI